MWLAMALAVTDALDGGISLEDGGTRAAGGFTCYIFINLLASRCQTNSLVRIEK